MIGKKIKDLLIVTNKKQIELANYLNISASRLSNYLSDKREPDIQMLVEMAMFFGVDLNYFSGREFKTNESITSKKINFDDENNEFIKIPIIQLCSKKKAVNKNKFSLPKIFLQGIRNSEENVTIFYITTDNISSNINAGDYIVGVKISAVPLKNADLVIEKGRNARLYRYYRDEHGIILIDVNDNKHYVRFESNDEIEDFYKVLWVFNKKYL